ncbi:MAG: serine phosphatase RsbU (regulator of sigma subunit) [Cyclobacteriaceae bacterium]|jgi:serine phosphatase RsbU (regulator of sigma subunit)
MNPTSLFKELKRNFSDISYSGLVLDDEIKFDNISSGLDPDDHEALVMRLYFLAIDPDKEIKFFINQYEENKYLYFIKIKEDQWLFVLSSDKSFAKLHFFLKFLLSETELEIGGEQEPQVDESTEEQQKLLSARRIQNLLLPDINKISKLFENIDLWYQPKDVVGGDFYWARQSKNWTWIVVGDCTGHSVEGALASVSVMSILNQVYDANGAPHWLIKNLHNSLNNMQEQKLELGYGIGCEMIVIKINNLTLEVEYSATGLNLYHFSPSGFKEFKTKKATLNPDRIIKYIRTRRLKLDKGDALFTHSDGLVDQLNENGKKLKVRNLKNVLKSKMAISKEELIQLVDAHRGEEEQTDDIVGLYLKV